MFTYQLPVEYDEDAKCDGVIGIINDVLPSEDDVKAFQEFLGYCLIRDVRFKKFMLFYGEKHTGKTTLLKMMWRLFGDGIDGMCKGIGTENICNMKLQDICNPRSEYLLAGLYNKILNIHDELPPYAIKDISAIKMLTGGSRLTVREIYKAHFSFIPFAKHVFTCNNLPQIHNDVEIFMDRLLLMNTTHVFDVGNNEDDITAVIESELSGLFNWVLEGYGRLMSNNKFTLSKASEDVCREYEFNANPLLSFCKLYMTRDPEAWIIKRDFYERYCNWCNENVLSPIPNEAVKTELKTYCPGIGSTQRRVGEGGKSEHIWLGYRCKGYDEAMKVINNSPGFFQDNNIDAHSHFPDKSDDEWAAQ
jgi:putative DNA primase/helicase